METVGPPPADAELNLLTEWGDPASGDRTRRAAIFSVGFHAAVILALILMPEEWFAAPPRRVAQVVRRVTPLVEPLTEFTQKRKNEGKLAKELDVNALQPRERIQTPKGAPSTTRQMARRPAEIPLPP